MDKNRKCKRLSKSLIKKLNAFFDETCELLAQIIEEIRSSVDDIEEKELLTGLIEALREKDIVKADVLLKAWRHYIHSDNEMCETDD